MSARPALRVYVVDDEPLAVKRLTRLLRETRRVEVVGSTVDPVEAVKFLSRENVDAVFLDIQMPGMNGFELLQKLPKEPAIVFTTAFDRFALDAFEVNSVDYLVKPIELERLEKALSKLERLRGTPQGIYVEEVSSWFGGGMIVRLKDGKRTGLQIARDRLKDVKERLEF